MARVRGATVLIAAMLCWAPGASGRAYVPPGNHVFAGLSGGSSIAAYQRMVGKHPAVFETFMTWNTPTKWLARTDSSFRARLALHISTSPGYGQPGVISPQQIADGRSDPFLISLGRNLARSHRIAYIRLMAEMNGYWNAYSAFSADGASRGAENSPHNYVQAWRRTVLILRGGRVSLIDRRLRALGLPPIRASAPRALTLPAPRLAFLWVPQDAGSPDIAANAPSAYWPGAAYVDWVGTDFYASYPNFALLDAFYSDFAGKPFVLSEWALYGADDPLFVRQLFAWVRAHPRVRMLNYYQGFSPSSPANLAHYPASRTTLAAELRSKRYLGYAPEYAHRPKHPSQPPAPTPPEQPPLPPAPGPPPGPPALCVPLAGVCVPGL